MLFRISITSTRRIFGNYNSLPTQLFQPIFGSILLPNFTSSAFSTSLQTIRDLERKPVSNPLYTFLPHTHNPNNIVNLICTNLKRNNGQIASLRQDIQWVLPHLGTDEISKVLLRCQSEPFISLSFFNWVTNDLGIRPTIQNYCIFVHILAWSREFTLAMKFLSELIELVSNGGQPSDHVFQNLLLCTKGCNWNPIVFDMLIKAYVKTGRVREGLRAFKNMIKIGFVPDVSACNCLLNGLFKSNRIDWCWKIYDEMGEMGISANSYTFNILTHVFCRDGDVAKVNEFLEEEGFDPDIVTYNTLIDSYCRKGRLEDAFYLYKIMYRRRVPPDLVTYTALMKALRNNGKLKEAHQLFHRMVHRGLIPDVVAYNILISGYCKECRMQEARLLLREMISRELLPSSFTCHLLVQGYVKAGKLLSALNLVVEFQRLGLKISLDIYNYLVIALCQQNKPNAAKSILRRMLADGCDATLEIYNLLIESFCKCDGLEEAFSLKDEMADKGIKPDFSTYKALIISLCSRLCKSVEGEILMREMVEAALVPDTAICRALVNVHCKKRDLAKAESLLIYFSMEFHIYDTESYNAVIKVCCEEGDVLKSLELHDKMSKLGFVPNSLTCRSLIHGLSKGSRDQRKLQKAAPTEASSIS